MTYQHTKAIFKIVSVQRGVQPMLMVSARQSTPACCRGAARVYGFCSASLPVLSFFPPPSSLQSLLFSLVPPASSLLPPPSCLLPPPNSLFPPRWGFLPASMHACEHIDRCQQSMKPPAVLWRVWRPRNPTHNPTQRTGPPRICTKQVCHSIS